jgi:hypothetical protein
LLNDGANLTLTIIGDNTLIAGNDCAGIQAPYGTTLTIDGAGSLKANGGGFGAGIGGDGGKLRFDVYASSGIPQILAASAGVTALIIALAKKRRAGKGKRG